MKIILASELVTVKEEEVSVEQTLDYLKNNKGYYLTSEEEETVVNMIRWYIKNESAEADWSLWSAMMKKHVNGIGYLPWVVVYDLWYIATNNGKGN